MTMVAGEDKERFSPRKGERNVLRADRFKRNHADPNRALYFRDVWGQN